MASTIATAQEYLVKLGVSLDTANMNKLIGFLQSGKVKAAALAAGLTALTTVIYKFMKQQTGLEQSYEALARKESKSIEYIRAREIALKAMGKTQQEVAKDPSLQKMYNNLIKLGKEMALPDFKNVMKDVNSLTEAWYRLRTTIQYVLQWVNYHLLRELSGPMKEIKAFFDSLQKWFQLNIRQISINVARFLGDFMRGIVAIFDIGKKIGSLINGLPASVKAVGSAILAMVAMLKSGPLGWLIGAVTMIGDLMKDYENYLAVKARKTDVGVALSGLWDIMSGEGKLSDKLQEAFDQLNGENGVIANVSLKITGSISEWAEENSEQFSSVGELIGTAIVGSANLILNIAKVLSTAITGFFKSGMFSEALDAYTGLGTDIANGLYKALSGDAIKTAFTENSASDAVFGGLMTWLLTGSFTGGIATTLAKAFKDAMANPDEAKTDWDTFGTELMSAVLKPISDFQKWTQTEDYTKFTQTVHQIWGSVLDLLFGAKDEETGTRSGEGLIGAIGELLGPMANAAGDLFREAFTGVWDIALDVLFGQKSEETGKRDGKGLVNAIGEMLAPTAEAAKDLFEAAFSGIWEFVLDLLFGEKDETTGKRLGNGLIESIGELVGPLTNAVLDLFSTAFSGIWGAISPYLDLVGAKILAWLQGTVKGTVFEGLFSGNQYTGKYVFSEGGGLVTVGDMMRNGVPDEQIMAAIKNSNGNAYLDYINKNSNNLMMGDLYPWISSSGSYTPNGNSMMNEMYNLYASAMGSGDYDTALDILRKAGEFKSEYNRADPHAIVQGITTDQRDVDVKLRSYIDQVGNGVNTEPAGMLPNISGAMNEVAIGGTIAAGINPAATALETVSSGIVTGGNAVEYALNGLVDKINSIKVPNVGWNAGGGPGGQTPKERNAMGGRLGGPKNILAGEDGAEYVVPVTKPGRAIPLITSALREMGGSAARKVLNMMGMDGGADTIGGGGLDAALLGGAGASISNNYNVNAPVTIYVNGGGADAESIGNTAYNAAERSLIRTVKGVFA